MPSQRDRKSAPPFPTTQPREGTELGTEPGLGDHLMVPEAPASLRVEASVIPSLVGTEVPLVGERVGIGRGQDPRNHLALEHDGRVSWRHAEIVRGLEGWFLRDVESKNGTFLNGARVASRRLLRDGDRIQIGDTRLSFQEGVRSVAQPYPLAIARVLWRAHAGALARRKAITDALELALTFLVAAQLGALSARIPRELGPALARAFSRSPSKLSMGHWLGLARQLGRVVVESQLDEPCIRTASAALVGRDGSDAPLARELARAIESRNEVAHGVVAHEDALSGDDEQLIGVLDRFLDTLAVFAAATFVSRERLVRLDRQLRCETEVRVHHGAEQLFSLETRLLPHDLLEGWCYLLGQDERPILLAPFFGVGVPKAGRTLEIGVRRSLAIGRAAARCELKSVTGGASFELAYPGEELDPVRAALEAIEP